MNRVVVGIGSNINPHKNIQDAYRLLSARFTIVAVSKFRQTTPIGLKNQPDFFNGAYLIETPDDYQTVKKSLKQIESSTGRTEQSDKCGPRTVDLDIILWNDDIVDTDFYSRDFLKKSVLELIPDLPY